jgi:hypothetical protein|uniref:Uncharacterized protein n=1 Tax=Enterococcus faecium TaxID=1352 RepID=A0A8F5V7D5_ENTFC|nr:hypothetical protein Tn6711_000047 [Enterococcus faecium]QXO84726.1 hypothetical protein Tn6712_000099 [Enterococcus faecium]
MWQIYGEKEVCGTRGGLASRRKQSKKEVFQKIAERRNIALKLIMKK